MVEWVVTSSALIILVLILRVLVKDRVSPRLRYALWGLVLLRLLIPGTFWESRASVMTPEPVQEIHQIVERIPRSVEIQPDGSAVVYESGSPGQPAQRVIPADRTWVGEGYVSRSEATIGNLQYHVRVRNALLGVWMAGIGIVGVFLLAVNLKFARNLSKRRRALGKYRGRRVFLADGLATPCLFGLFRPAIYLTPGLEADGREHVLAHEYAHFRQGDHLWAVLRGVCLAVHWYNPLVWLAAALSRRDCELSCDEGAIRLLGEGCRADYGRTLVGLVARQTRAGDLACCATTMTGGKSALQERVALLVKRPRTTAAMACLVVAACLAFVACTFTGAAVEGEEPDQAEPFQDGASEPPRAPEEEPEEEPERPGSPEEPPVPLSLDSLPTTVGNWEEPIVLAAQMEEVDIAVYCDTSDGRLYLRYGEHIQAVEEHSGPPEQPELYYRDLDADGDMELAMIYCAGRGTGMRQWDLVVYEWDGAAWTGHSPDFVQPLIEDFTANHTLSVYPEQGRAVVGYGASEVEVDMDKRFAGQDWQSGSGFTCALQEAMYCYFDGWPLKLRIDGEILPEGYPPMVWYSFDYVCDVAYHADGTFSSGLHWLETDYPWLPKLDGNRLTPVFRGLLAAFIGECRQLSGDSGADLSHNCFAICDVNGDGRDELITVVNDGPMAAQAATVYDGNGNRLLVEFPAVTYYDNGYALAEWSHNQGASGDKLWPYTLFKYDAEAGGYVSVANVNGWDRKIRDSALSYDGSTIPFPDGVDVDGDGFVYYIITEEGGYAPDYGTPVDYAEYAAWLEGYIGGANVVDVAYVRLLEENIRILAE